MVKLEDNTPPRSPEVSENIELDEEDILEVIEINDLDGYEDMMEDEEDLLPLDESDEESFSPEREDAVVVLNMHSSSVLSCSIHPNNMAIIATGGMDDNVFVCDTSESNEPKLLLKCAATESVDCVRFSTDGQYFAMVNLDGGGKIFNTVDFSVQYEFDMLSDFVWMAWHPTFPILVASTNCTITMFNVPAKTSKVVSASTSGDIKCGKIFPDGKRLVYGTDGGAVLVVDMKTGTTLCTVRLSAPGDSNVSYAYCVDVHKDGTIVLCGCDDGDINLVNPDTSKVIKFPRTGGEEDSVEIAEFSKTEEHKNIVACGHLGGKLRFWDSLRQSLRAELVTGSAIVSLKWHPLEPVVFTCQALHKVLMVDARSGTVIRSFFGHSQSLNAIDISRDGSRLVTASNDSTARIYLTDSTSPMES